MAYNQHQSFYLRDRWLGKALRNIEKDEGFFFRKDAFEKMGLGKNMVKSLRHWVKATGVVEENSRAKKQTLTIFGEIIRKYDIMLKHPATAALLHYYIVKEDEPSTAWFWFFNIYEETKMTREEIFQEFVQWVQTRETRVISENSLKRDVDCLVNMYTAGEDNEDPEEVTLSPIARIGLLREEQGVIYRQEMNIDVTEKDFLFYVLLNYHKENQREEYNIEELLTKPGLLGKTYNMNRSTILKLLSDWEEKYELVFRRTNNLDVIRIPEKDPNEFLIEQYQQLEVKMHELRKF